VTRSSNTAQLFVADEARDACTDCLGDIFAARGNTGYTMDVYQESPGVYFEHLVHVTLSHTSWTILYMFPSTLLITRRLT